MDFEGWAYFLFGTSLTVIFLLIIIHYYRKHRHDFVEEAKYRMLEDDEDHINSDISSEEAKREVINDK